MDDNVKNSIDLLDNVPIKALIERMKMTQVWARDVSDRDVKRDFSFDLWINETGLAPGVHKVKSSILYGNYVQFCNGKSIKSPISIQLFGRKISSERIFPKHMYLRIAYYHLNKDVTPEAEREKEKAKKALKKAKKQSLGTKTPDIQ